MKVSVALILALSVAESGASIRALRGGPPEGERVGRPVGNDKPVHIDEGGWEKPKMDPHPEPGRNEYPLEKGKKGPLGRNADAQKKLKEHDEYAEVKAFLMSRCVLKGKEFNAGHGGADDVCSNSCPCRDTDDCCRDQPRDQCDLTCGHFDPCMLIQPMAKCAQYLGPPTKPGRPEGNRGGDQGGRPGGPKPGRPEGNPGGDQGGRPEGTKPGRPEGNPGGDQGGRPGGTKPKYRYDDDYGDKDTIMIDVELSKEDMGQAPPEIPPSADPVWFSPEVVDLELKPVLTENADIKRYSAMREEMRRDLDCDPTNKDCSKWKHVKYIPVVKQIVTGKLPGTKGCAPESKTEMLQCNDLEKLRGRDGHRCDDLHEHKIEFNGCNYAMTTTWPQDEDY